MDHHHKKGGGSGSSSSSSQDVEVRKGPWTMEEDLILINYIATHGEGVWNSLAKAAGLKRTGKSCRLRWLNYLRPDVRRGNITPEEQLLIMELHSKWGNRWSKIAKHLPGRTDNEIKNFWRTRIQKQLKQTTNNTMLNRTLNICNHTTTMDNNNNTIDHHYQQQQSSDHMAPSTSQMSTSAASSTCCISGAPTDSYSVSSYSHDQPMEGYPMVTGLGGGPTSGGGFYSGGGGGGYVYNGFPSGSSSSSMAPAAVSFGNNCPTGVEGNDNFWNMEELWSMQFFNGD